MNVIKNTALVLGGVILSVVGLSACQPATVAEVGSQPPAATSEETPTTFESTESETEGTEVEGESAPDVADFSQKYTYPDGTEIRFTKITTGALTKSDVEYWDEYKAGQTWVKFAYKITNGSKVAMDQYAYLDVTYGPDGDAAESASLLDAKGSPNGKILPGKSKTGEEIFMIPAKYQDNVVAEIDIAADYETAIFAGAVS